jgi:hypothetical protein
MHPSIHYAAFGGRTDVAVRRNGQTSSWSGEPVPGQMTARGFDVRDYPSEGTQAFDALPTSELIERLATCGLEVPPGLPEAILRRSDATDGLIQLVRLARYWYETGPGEGWAPIHALHLLAAGRRPEGLDVLLDVLRFHAHDLGDWLTEVVPSWLVAFGPAVVPRLESMLRDETLDPFVRMVVASGLVAHARSEARLAPGIKDLLLEVAIDTPNRLVSGSLAVDLVEFRDPSLKGNLRTLFVIGKVPKEEMDWEEVEEIYAGTVEPILVEIEDPMEHFRPENLRRLREVQEGDRRFERWFSKWTFRDSTGGPRRPKRPTVGRNDSCPCGSGKKFKRCHGER